MSNAPSTPDLSATALAERLRRMEARLDRERRARAEAEHLLEEKSRALFDANLALSALANDLEQRVEVRTEELRTARQAAVELAETDALTGIANRAAFTRRLDDTLRNTHAIRAGVALLLIDLDNFKHVNDTQGHQAGDTVLVEMARRLSDALRPDDAGRTGDLVARLGGDEFAVIAKNIGAQHNGLRLAQRLLAVLCRPVVFNGVSIPCYCSIGVASAELPNELADKLLGNADLALYASKRMGRARVTCYESNLRVAVEHRARHETEVREAVLADHIEPWFQPVFRCDQGRHTGAEMLARWHVPGGEVRSPPVFLNTVEELGLLDVMMENMLRRALPEALPLVISGAMDYLTVNVSPTQFNAGWALRALPLLLAQVGFPARALVIELTETALLHDTELTRSMLFALDAQGMRIAIDDFGVGYSNFSLLRQLPCDFLKLDRTLSMDVEHDESARALTECILALAARLKIQVVAEGVETLQQSRYLLEAGCAAQQGFLHARPQRDLAALFTRADTH
ncbi:MAG: EAL domain-containing protein [Burkholderiales bacterium]|nr:EAL domain-containing protein [Burkholderiales bacterium]